MGIYANEMADAVARHLACPGVPTLWLETENIDLHLRHLHLQENTVDWLTGKYAEDFTHFTRTEHCKLQLPSKREVPLSRLLNRTLPT